MDAATALQSRLIGAILVDKKLVTGEQLERALQLQETSGERLGEIVVAEFGVSRLELASVLAEQWAELEDAERASPSEPARATQAVDPLTPAEVQLRRPIGEIFVELGFVSSDQLDAALDVQRETGARIGEILVEQGSLTRLDLASALAEQWSALQKLRPPAPVADPQPWQNGVPVAQPAGQGLSADDSAAFASLEERLRIVERAASAAPWQEDLRLVKSDLRAAVAAVEERLQAAALGTVPTELPEALAAVTARIETLEGASVSTELAALRSELDALKERPATVEGLADLREAVERLENRPDRADEIAHLATEISTLASRLDEPAGNGELAGRLDAVAGQAELAQTGIAGLSRRIDDLAGLEGRLDDVAARLPAEEVIDELRRALAELATQAGNDDRADQGADIALLVARLDQLAARLEDVAAAPAPPDLTPRIDDLAARVDEVLATIPVVALDRRGELERLATEIGDLDARTQRQLDALAAREPDPGPVDELRARVDGLAAAVEREPDTTQLEGLRAMVEELAAAVERQSDQASVEDLRLRVNLLAATAARTPDAEPLDVIRTRLEELAAAVEQDESISTLESRVRELEDRLADATPAAELREELRRVTESTISERESLAQALYARVEEITATVPREDELTELRSRLDELAARPTEDQALQARVDELATRLESLGAVEDTIAGLRGSLEGVDSLRADALATEARLVGLEAAIDSLAELEKSVRESVDSDLAVTAEALAARLDAAEGRLDTVAALEERVCALATELERASRDDGLRGVVDELRVELEALAARPPVADPGARLQKLSQKLDRSARDGQERVEGLAEELNVRLTEADHARASGQLELGNRLDEALGAIRVDLEAQATRLGSQLEAQWNETAALRAQVEELHESAAGRASFEVRVESTLEQRLAELAGRITDEVAGARADAAEAVAVVHGEASSLAARIDELLGLRHADVQAARAAGEELAARVDALAGLRADDAESARAAAADLSGRLESLAESLHAEASAARATADGLAAQVATQIGELHGWRADDRAAAELAGAELAARLDDHARRSAAAALAVEQALRQELGGVAARLEERDAHGIEAREELRSELERVASSVGWRLERIEESLAADDMLQLKAAVTELERRLEGQAAMGEEQVRVTERALRKGLASLGEKLVDSESAYAEAGNALRRSIERLGAAVVEADARMADQIPVSDAEGCVAFAPTAAGYRLVELPGKPPEVGSTVELEGIDGPLLVTRYGRSPLPLDSRPCAYLDRA